MHPPERTERMGANVSAPNVSAQTLGTQSRNNNRKGAAYREPDKEKR